MVELVDQALSVGVSRASERPFRQRAPKHAVEVEGRHAGVAKMGLLHFRPIPRR